MLLQSSAGLTGDIVQKSKPFHPGRLSFLLPLAGRLFSGEEYSLNQSDYHVHTELCACRGRFYTNLEQG